MTEKPNILLITTDQQQFDTVGEAAPAFMRTPRLDLLRREGVTFASPYADCPICVPSRVSIVTGTYVTTHGGRSNGLTSQVMGRHDTLPAYLRELGYQTAAIGKMHFGPERVRHGFDEMILPVDDYRQMARSGGLRGAPPGAGETGSATGRKVFGRQAADHAAGAGRLRARSEKFQLARLSHRTPSRRRPAWTC